MKEYEVNKRNIYRGVAQSAVVAVLLLWPFQGWSRKADYGNSPIGFMWEEANRHAVKDNGDGVQPENPPENQPVDQPNTRGVAPLDDQPDLPGVLSGVDASGDSGAATEAGCAECQLQSLPTRSQLRQARREARAIRRAAMGRVPLFSTRDPIRTESAPAPNIIMARVARAAAAGYGRAAKNMCYRGVKQILVAAGAVRPGWRTGGAAIDAMQDLPRAGFHNDRSACFNKGTVRIYKGLASRMPHEQARRFMARNYGLKLTAGDTYGHAEVVGSDSRFYHFNPRGSDQPLDVKFPGRRILVGCFVK